MIDVEKLQELGKKMRVLYAEDDKEVQSNTAMILEELFAEVVTADDGKEALQLYKNSDFDIILTDINMPVMNGIELIRSVNEIAPDQIVVVISAHNETEYFMEGIQRGIFGYIIKPIDYDQLFDTLWKVVNVVKDRKENLAYKERMEDLVQKKTDEIEKNYQKINEMLTTDKTTGLPNANMLYQYLDLYTENNVSVYMLKIDNYELYDESMEPESMKVLVKNVAHYIISNLYEDVKLYRYADDEFVAVLNSSDVSYLSALPKQLSAFFKETPVGQSASGKDIHITLSIALAIDESPTNIMQKLRVVMTEMQNHGLIGQFRVYEEKSAHVQDVKNKSLWFEKIREIIEEGKIVPYFQPIIDNQSGQVSKYECLVRIEDDGSVISPVHFLEAAKKTGLLSSLTRIMINKCFEFFQHTSLSFSINLTNEDLMDDNFVDFILARQKHFGIDSSHVTFEILEEILFDYYNEQAFSMLGRLRDHGFKLSLDDFGSERSNFSRLTSSISLDFIKIDGQFIKDLHKNEKNYQIVKSISNLAKEFDILTIAEFVSCEEEFEKVCELGIDYSQGYYFYKPVKEID